MNIPPIPIDAQTGHQVFKYLIAFYLQEVLLHETYFEGVTPFALLECARDRVCTHPVIDGGSICFMDEGISHFPAQLLNDEAMKHSPAFKIW